MEPDPTRLEPRSQRERSDEPVPVLGGHRHGAAQPPHPRLSRRGGRHCGPLGAFYLARAGIPLARGWYRQDDFPQNSILYGPLTPHVYLHWLRHTAVRYVVLTDAPSDYSAQRESALIRAHPHLLRQVVRLPGTTIFEVAHPTPLIRGSGPAHVVSLGPTRALFTVSAKGTYHVAIRYSPYWRARPGCVGETRDGDVQLTGLAPGTIELEFQLGVQQFLDALNKSGGTRCSSPG